MAALVAVLGLLYLVLALWQMRLVTRPLADCDAHLPLQFRGEATGDDCATLSIDALHESLRRDDRLALWYAITVGGLSLLLRPPHHLDPRLRRMTRIGQFLAPVAAAFDILENELMTSWTTHDVDGFHILGEWHPHIVTAVALVKWTLLLAAVANLLWLVAGGFAERPFPIADVGWRVRLTRWWVRNRWRIDAWATSPATEVPEPGAEADHTPPFEPGSVLLCCSGGGIRSAGFTLGALYELERIGLTDRVRTLAAVSGGNYAATAWVLQRLGDSDGSTGRAARTANDPASPDSPPPTAHALICRLTNGSNPLAREEWDDADALLRVRMTDTSREIVERSNQHTGRHRYLASHIGGLPRSVVFAIGAVLANVAQLLAIVIPLGWLLGRFLRLPDVHPTLEAALVDPTKLQIDDRHWQPPLLLLGAALVLVVLSALFSKRWQRIPVRALASLSAAVGGLALVVLVAAPWTMVQLTQLGDERTRAFTVGGISLVAVGGAVFRLAADPLRRQAPRLGGVVLAAGLVLLLGKVAADTIDHDGAFADGWLVVGAVVAFVLSAFVLDTQTASIRELYRTRLAAAFCTDGDGGTSKLTWQALRDAEGRIPELVVCCAASRVGLAPNGMPAESFTISQNRVRHYRSAGPVSVPTERYVSTLRSLALRRLNRPAGWMATSGAAFASAMGQASLGSTNALLAALNADLGVWLPAPRVVGSPTAPDVFPPVRLGHLVNEIFGIYSDNDEQVFVADGGHVENLGLLELLQEAERCGLRPGVPHTLVSIDASGDDPGSFATLRAALRVADTVLPERLWFDTSELDESKDPAETSVYAIPFWRWDERPTPGTAWQRSRRVGIIYYAKLQPCLDQSAAVRKFSMIDPKFPQYSTANQLLDDQQFAFLLTAGRDAAEALHRRLRRDGLWTDT